MLCHNYVTLCFNYVYYGNYTHYFKKRKYKLHKSMHLNILGVPRVSCSRTIEDNTLARPVYDMDLALLGSSHGVPMEVGCRRWQAMATREPNSALPWQLANLNPNACGAFELTACLLWWAGLIMPVANKLSAPCLSIYCGNTHFSPAKWWKKTQQTKLQSFCTSKEMHQLHTCACVTFDLEFCEKNHTARVRNSWAMATKPKVQLSI